MTTQDDYEWKLTIKGGPGSGHWGHAGRPGFVGGSVPANIAMSIATGRTARERQAAAAGRGRLGKRPSINVPQFTTREEAEQWVKDLGIAEDVYFDGFDVKVCQGIAESLAYHKQIAPDLQLGPIGNNRTLSAEMRKAQEPATRKFAEEIGGKWGWTRDKIEKYIKKRLRSVGVRMSPNAYAIAMSDAFFVSFKWAKDYDKIKARLEQDVEMGWHPPGCDTVKSIIDHEMGHVLDRHLGGLFKLNVASIARQYRGQAPSEYARKNWAEYFAEAWAEYLNNPNPGPVATEIGNRVMELLGGAG